MDGWSIKKRAIAHYGKQKQLLKAVEEMAELTKEILKYIDGENNREKICEEMADVGIMLDQMSIIFTAHDDVERWQEIKLDRLWMKMEKR